MYVTSSDQNNVAQIATFLPSSEASSVPSLDSDVFSVIFSHLNIPTLGVAAQACKQWKTVLSPDFMDKMLVEAVAFGPKDWSEHLKEKMTEEEIKAAYAKLPKNMSEMLKEPCPAFPDKLVRDSHALVYIPKGITLTALGEILEKHLAAGNRRVKGYDYIWNQALTDLDKPVEEGYWVLMTKDVLGGAKTDGTGSRDKPYEKQQEVVQNLKAPDEEYEVPKTMEAVAVIIAHFLKSKEYLFGQGNLCTYTRCQENIQGYQIVVGGFASAGLDVSTLLYDGGEVGVAGLRKFF